MAIRMRARGLVTAAVAAALLAVASGSEAVAVEWRPRPGMVYLSDMPKDGTTWYGVPAARGWRSPACGRSWPVPEVNVWSRSVSTSETASGGQTTVVFQTEAEAIAFAAYARQVYADCPTNRDDSPDTIETAYDYGAVDVEEGATVQGMRVTYTFNDNHHNHLFGVGRDGDTVTLIEWESNWSAPPVDYFKSVTVKNVVNRLY
ncbi:hypothetical protein [Streptomyces sp. NPDC051211]|uniref:hypothetical protein n=1 Tax=Streptomyces sp. NPDC051211 TaxID=3154643 RepID=UPI00344F139F